MPDSTSSFLRRGIVIAAVALPLCVAAFAVVMAGSLLADGLQNDGARRTLQAVGVALLLATGFDALVLLGLLGLRAAQDELAADDESAAADDPTPADDSHQDAPSTRP